MLFSPKAGAKNSGLKAHFIGIGGIGMSNLAYWFLAAGWSVSGSDIAASQTTRELHKAGIRVKIGHKKANLPRGCNLVIYSQAVTKKNPELKEARRLGIPAASYPEVVGRFTRSYKTIAVAGAHGKSTTSSLLALVLENAGLEPAVIVGTKLKEFGGKGFRKGKSEYLVVEADEYGGAFLHYSPTLAVITNIDREHLDFYRNLSGVKRAFVEFMKNVKPNGALVLNRDDKNLGSLQKTIRRIVQRNGLKLIWYSLWDKVSKKIRRILFIPGRHNISNALAVYKSARFLGIPEKKIFEVFQRYRGSWRRLEYRGMFHASRSPFPIPVYDDYAHHPTEIKATLEAVREKYPQSKIVCVFEPHQAERLKKLFRDFQTAFEMADITLLLPIYRVAGREREIEKEKIKKKSLKTAEDLAQAMQKKYPNKLIFYLSHPKNLRAALEILLPPHLKSKTPNPKFVIIMMGAGNIVNYTNFLISERRKR
jgi:UDP-N-acetylmuramate--alanine ligase